MIISQCAPKLGPVLMDPLILEISDPMDELPPPPPIPVANAMLRQENNPEDVPRQPCQGYDFDDKICKLINNRILCGYNKNTGEIVNTEIIVDMGNGCRVRGDRLECGYKPGSYIGRESMRSRPTRTSMFTSPILMKLKAAAITTTTTIDTNIRIIKLKAVSSLSNATNASIDSDISSNETELSDTSPEITETNIVEDLNLSFSTTLSESHESQLSTVTPPSITNNTTSSTSNESLPDISSESLDMSITSSDISQITAKAVEIIDTTNKEKTIDESTLSKSENTTTESPDDDTSPKTSKTLFNKIRIKRRNAPLNKTKHALTRCVQKYDRIVCYDEHFLPNRRRSRMSLKIKL